jgi:hypothetical protein
VKGVVHATLAGGKRGNYTHVSYLPYHSFLLYLHPWNYRLKWPRASNFPGYYNLFIDIL